MAITEIAPLATVKEYLRIPTTNTTDDDVLQSVFMPAATRVIEREIGHIIAKPIRAERHNGGKNQVWLRELPVLYVENVEEGWGYYDWELDDQEVNSIPALSIWAYSLDNKVEGMVTRRSAGSVAIPFVAGINNIRVDYVAGRYEVPENAVLAFCELIGYWYRWSQLRSVNQPSVGGGFGAIENSSRMGDDSINIGIPEGVIEMLKPNRRRPIVG